ncbi:transposase domain-containing protein [Streptomyces sp. NPDC059866]|uniref:transposase domain-containing protein n=1 Tax=Streptomyces sp. NPDC059866 TaxID=3346978 RepID=UPI003661107E
MAQSVTGGTDVFAPGHIGELTQVIPPELVDAVLDETGARERRLLALFTSLSSVCSGLRAAPVQVRESNEDADAHVVTAR